MSTELLNRQPALSLGRCPLIETGRLVLRPHRLEDADAIAFSLSDFAVARMLSRVPQPYHRQDALDWLKSAAAVDPRHWNLAITLDGENHIGMTGLELRHGQWRIGYWLGRSHWGKGLMTEAVSAAIDRFFAQMPDAVLHSGAFADNGASLRIQEKLGFRVVGGNEVYSMSRNAVAPHIVTELTAAAFRR